MSLSISGKTINDTMNLYTKLNSQTVTQVDSNSYEFEFRLGKFNDSGFVPGVSKEVFDTIMIKLREKYKYTHSKSKVVLYANGIREIISDSGIIVQKKDRIDNPVVVNDIGRFVLSKEVNIGHVPYNEKQLGVRYRERFSFRIDVGTIDLTIIKHNESKTFEIEIEYDNNLTYKQIFDAIKQLVIINNDAEVLNDFEKLFKKGIVFNNAINMKRKYFDQLHDYIITPKWDGTRMFMYVHRSGVFVINKTTTIRTSIKIGNELVNTIFDGEYFDGDKYIAFDILFLQNNDLRNEPRIKRTLLLEQTRIDYKIPFELAEVGYGFTLYDNFVNYTTKYPEHILDGVVFAPRDSTYYNKQTLKYKPISLLTIDFLIKVNTQFRYPHYELYVQGKEGIQEFRHLPYIQELSDESRKLVGKGNKIIECKWEGNTFVPYRIRSDKTTPNFTTIADDIWEDINNPITVDEMKDTLFNISSNFKKLLPFEGQMINVGSTKYVVTNTGHEKSLQRSVAYSMNSNFQLMKESERVDVISKYNSSINSISLQNKLDIKIIDLFGKSLLYSTTNQFTKHIILTYIANPIFYSVSQLVSEGVCSIPLRIFMHEDAITNRKSKALYNQVACHYDALDYVPQHKSSAENIRKFNNVIKSMVISSNTKSRDAVLDLGSGKGGDLQKWCLAKISFLTSVDISKKSLIEAERRFQNMNWCKFGAEWIHANAFIDKLHLSRKYDIVSAQFSFHYAFESEESVRTALLNISSALKSGGKFIATVPNSSELISRANKLGNKFGNELYTVNMISNPNKEQYGIEYLFTLVDSVDTCPEYMIPLEKLREVAKEYSLTYEYGIPFNQYFNDNMNKYTFLINKLGLKPLTTQEEEVASLYMAIQFTKL